MMSMCLSAITCVLLLSSQAELQSNDIDEASLQRLKSEGQTAWGEVATSSGCIDVAYDLHEVGEGMVRGKKNTIDRQSHLEATWDPLHSKVLIERRSDNPSLRSRTIVNPTYRFSVGWQKTGSPVLGTTRAITPPWQLDVSDKSSLFPLEAGYSIHGVALKELMSNPEFKLLTVKRIKSARTDSELVHLEYKHTGLAHPTNRLLKGAIYWADLNSGSHWLIESAGVKQVNPAIDIRQELTYQTTELGVPFPKTLQILSSDKDSKEEDVYTFSPPLRSVRSDDEFYLPHYGFPETIIPKTTPPSRMRAVIISVCVLGLLVAGGLYLLAARYGRMKNKQGHVVQPEGAAPPLAKK